MKKLVGLVLVAVMAVVALKGLIYYRVTSQLDEAVAAASPFARVSYGGVSSTLAGALRIEDVRAQVYATDLALSIDEVGVDFGNLKTLLFFERDLKARQLPSQMRLHLNHLRLDLQALAPHLQALPAQRQSLSQFSFLGCEALADLAPLKVLQQLGYSELDITLQTGYRWHAAAQQLLVDSDFGWHDMTASRTALQFEGVAELSPAGVLSAPDLQRVTIRVEDQGYNQRLAAQCAASQDITPDEFITLHTAMLKTALQDKGITLGNNLFDVYRYYLDGQGPVTLKMSPGSLQKLANLGLYNPRAIPQLLGLEVFRGDEPIGDIQLDWDRQALKNSLQALAQQEAEPVDSEVTPSEAELPEESLPAYVEIRPALLDQSQLHQTLQVTLADQRVFEGRLSRVQPDRVYLDVPLASGYATLPLARADIVTVKRRR